jgi:hypothetical protein
MTSHELFAAMSPALAGDVIEFSHVHDRKLYKAALEAVAQARKVRAVFLERQPRPERQETLISTLIRPALSMASDTLLRNWLLKKHAALLCDFLNALGIAHENGVVEDLPKSVEDATLRGAVEQLLGKHPHEVVAVYLHAFNFMNAESWTNLDGILRSEPRLRLPGAGA